MELPPPTKSAREIDTGDIWEHVARYRFFGSYSVSAGVDAAVKDILKNKVATASKGEYQTVIGSFVCGSAFSIIVQTYTNDQYNSAIVFGYGSEALRYYKTNGGRLYRGLFETTFLEI